ncbi:DNA topoisomerase III [Bacillus sp. VT 712]|jgi:DNA topoisomerase III|uniref:DNA topoisomerase n=1 Tax=Priestia veravalensis TaxID=1414648 RepID=A0A0V8JHK3_9BACI|nr:MULTISPECIES: DNA topoisomerase III [Bacillaceae]KSU86532.1 DNA topoisomerase III [Priestia veravalensis]KZB90417.1 DNA topoisomerase III [Bacillus sp. VT 712]MCM3068024.1 DNA topoisomerase 3 [Priestia flexa]RIV10261.1 DNA topoisomerase III [Priestia flexa]SCC51195.1 DNA topoisomerase-3 [Priestia flexa]
MKSLVLAEKPSVARDLARVLGCTQTKKGYIEGPEYVVTWALGHLVELQTPEDYDNQYKTWRMEDLPIMPEKMKLKVIKKTSPQFRTVSQLAKRSDIKELIIATDAGREGELVARWIMEKVRWNKPFRRLWISSQTDKAIKQGFRELKPGKEFNRLYDSAVCRSEADWLIGLNVTRALTTKYEEPLSAGRVQTPTLAMIIEKEQQIQAFKPQPYWTLTAVLPGFEAKWQGGQEKRIFNEEKAKELRDKLAGEAIIKHVKKKVMKEAQPLPYDLNELQRDANKRFGFSAKKTLNVLQKLYEQHKLVTYPRTDSRYLTTDMVGTMKERLEAVSGAYKEEVRPLIAKNAQLPKRVVNNEKVSDHHAIIVTDQPVFLQDLSSDERKLYDLIAKRFMALFYPAYEFETVKVELEANGEQLVAQGKRVINLGFKQVTNSDLEEASLPHLQEGAALSIKSVEMKHALTEPPLRHSEADLLAQMEKHNLGTPATRADIIEKLLQNESIDRQNNRLHPTPKGKQLISLVADELKSPDLTAKWERELEAIAKGKGNAKEFLANIRKQTAKLVQQVKTSEETYKPHNLTGSKCPECGSFLKEKKTKQGRVLVCSSLECSYRRSKDPKLSNRRCPQCHKKMEIHDGKAGKYFQCRQCQVVEKAEDKKKKMTKREERKLLNKYSDDSDFGSSLGDALKQALKKKE